MAGKAEEPSFKKAPAAARSGNHPEKHGGQPGPLDMSYA